MPMALRNIYVYSRRVELRNTNGRVSFAQPGILVLEVYIHSIDIDLCHLPSWGGRGGMFCKRYKVRHSLPCGE